MDGVSGLCAVCERKTFSKRNSKGGIYWWWECMSHNKGADGPCQVEIIDGMGPEKVMMTRAPVDDLDHDHCAAHGEGPFGCCLCGAEFMPIDLV